MGEALTKGMTMRLLQRWSTARIILIAFTFSEFGSTMAGFALPIVYIAQTHNLAGAGLLAGVGAAAMFVGNLVGGLIADARSKRVFLFVFGCADPVFEIALVLLIVRGAFAPAVWAPLIALMFFCNAAEGSIESTSLRLVVDEAELAAIMGLRQTRAYLCTFLGPVAGGVLASINPALPFGVTAVTGVIGMLILLPVRREERLARIEGSAESKVDAILGGLSDMRHSRVLLVAALIFFFVPFALNGVLDVFTFGLANAEVAPWLISSLPVAVGLGGIAGSIVVPIVLKKYPLRAGHSTLVVMAAIAVLCVLMVVIPAWAVRLVLVALIAALAPLANPLFSFVMAYVPPERQGRDISLISALNLLPGVVTGPVAAALLPSMGAGTILVLAAPMLISVVLLLVTPALRNIPPTDEWAGYIAGLRGKGGVGEQGGMSERDDV